MFALLVSWVSGKFPKSLLNGNSKLTFNNSVLSSYLLIIAVQYRSFTFKRLTAFLSCYVPVSVFTFRLDSLIAVLSYGAVPNLLITTPYLGAPPLRALLFGANYCSL